MARKVVNRKVLREEVEAAEREGITKKKTKAATPTKRKSRSKVTVEARRKLCWLVCNQSGKPVATFEFHQKEAAEKKALALSQSGKSPHYVERKRVPVEEA
jgi:hypothetical protein